MKPFIISQGLPRVAHSALATDLGREFGEHFTQFKDSVKLQVGIPAKRQAGPGLRSSTRAQQEFPSLWEMRVER